MQVPLITLFALITLLAGCAVTQSPQRQAMGELGRFEFRNGEAAADGLVIGVPHGAAEPRAVVFAQSIRDRLGARLVIAYDFKTKRIPVDRPLMQSIRIPLPSGNTTRPTSVYPEFKKLLQTNPVATIKFYIGVLATDDSNESRPLEVASAGFSFEQVQAIKASYVRVRDRLNVSGDLPLVDLRINPLDNLSWPTDRVKNHGILMFAERGLILRLPPILTREGVRSRYGEVVTTWVVEAIEMLRRNPTQLPVVSVERHAFGRIETMTSRKNLSGVVIAAPHGSFDWYTEQLVEELGYRTGLATVITRGFTPTECGGWRLNVNRPTERRYPMDTLERSTERAQDVYRRYSRAVFKAAGGRLDFYIDIHQNGTQENIEVATLGVNREQALAIKLAYAKIRDRILKELPGAPKVGLSIEPVDMVTIGAWAAKDHGILRLAKSSLHIELPSQRLFYRENIRSAYGEILARLIIELSKMQEAKNQSLRAPPKLFLPGYH